jgi:hypothetical protein
MFDCALFIRILTMNQPAANPFSDEHIVRRIKFEGQKPLPVSIDESKRLQRLPESMADLLA